MQYITRDIKMLLMLQHRALSFACHGKAGLHEGSVHSHLVAQVTHMLGLSSVFIH